MAVIGQFFTSLFAQVWRVLEINMPFFNIPVWSVWAGIFLIQLSIKVFRRFTGGEPFKSNSSGKYPRKGDNDA